MKSFLLIVLACFCAAWAGKAQMPYLQQMHYPYQIPTKTIYAMLLSRQGELYLGTDKGLFRFNGKASVAIPFQGARQSDFTHMKEDQHGRIWGMNFARQIFYLEGDTLRPFPIYFDDAHGVLKSLALTDDRLWVLTSQSLASYDLKTKKRLSLYVDGVGGYFERIGVYRGKIYATNMQKILISQGNAHQQIEKTPFDCYGSFVEWRGGWYCVQTRDNASVVLQWKDKRTHLPAMRLPKEVYIHHCIATDSTIWLCARQGGFSLNPQTGKTELVFPLSNVTGVVQDFQGNYWVSTLYDGLWFCPSLHTVAYTLHAEKRKGEISSVYAHEGALYCGTTDGYVLRLPASQGKTGDLQGVEAFYKASSGETRRIIFDAENRRIASGFSVFDFESKPVIQGFLLKDARFGKLKGQASMLTATSNGFRLFVLDKEMPHREKGFMGLGYDSITKQRTGYPAFFDGRLQRSYSVELDTRNQRFWIGYDNGLFMYDAAGKPKELQKGKEPLIAYNLALDGQARLWVGTFQQGLLLFEGEHIQKHWQAGKGLKDNYIRKIVVGKDKVWIGTNAEIGYFDTHSLRFVDVLAQSGLTGFAYKDFYPTEEGLWIALPQSLLFVPHILPSSRAALRLLPVERLPDNIFKIKALHYKNPAKVQILYRLKGIDAGWNVLSETEATIRYTHLPKGDYTLEIFAEDNVMGVRSDKQILHFKIAARWWETWLFYGFIFIIANAFIAWFLYQYFDRIRKRQLLKEQLWISQLKALRSQMNPHFLYNILNTVQGLVYSNRKTEAGELLGNFSDLMRKTLQASENAYIPLREEMEILELYIVLEKARFDGSFSYQWISENVEDFMHAHIPSMLIQPFIENAFKHGLLHKKGDKHLKILFKVKETPAQNILCITIDDNGIGRQASQDINQKRKQKTTGFATKAFEQRIALLNQKKHTIDFQIEDKISPDGTPEGTTVSIEIFI